MFFFLNLFYLSVAERELMAASRCYFSAFVKNP